MNTLKGIVLGAIILSVPLLTLAAVATYKVQSGDTWQSIAVKQGITLDALMTLNEPTKGDKINIPGAVVVIPPPATSTPTTTVGQIILKNVYTTAYGWPDNTPAGANTTIGGVSGTAGGTGTYASPVTLATGFSLIGGKEIDDYAAGTKFYDPNLRKYFAVGDTCGDGNSPQTEACHVSEIKGTIQLDMWVGGQGANSKSVLACEDAVTRVGTLVENPASNYAVVAGPVFGTSCSAQFGDTIVAQ